MVDIHCHVLPCLDDGAKDWETSLAMCKLAYEDGTRHIVATPHANSQYTFDRERCGGLLAELQTRAPQLTFSLGCDFQLSYDNVQDAIKNPKRYAIGEGRYVLTELSDYATRAQVKDLLFLLHCAGLSTVITHPERNQLVGRYPDFAAELVDMGSDLQITANALTGGWGRRVRKRTEQMLKDGLVAVIASDAHEATRRMPVLSAGLKAAAKIVGKEAALLMVEENPRKIVGLA